METKACTKCHGTKVQVHESFTSLEGKVYPRREDPCCYCDGRGEYAPPDVPAILKALVGRAGFRRSKPGPSYANRVYYVWRMARFHGGADVCLPVMGMLLTEGDPYRDDLDKLANAVARKVFGTDFAAAHRWGRALGYLSEDVSGLPAGAYEGGPSYDDNKPLDEVGECL